MKLFAMGDMSFGDQPLYFGFGIMSTGLRTGHDDLFQHVSSKWTRHDIVFANLESVTDLESVEPKGPFESRINRGLKSSAQAIVQGGINLVSLSNNHMLDHGEKSFRKTIEVLDANGVQHVGSLANRQCIIERNGLRVGFLAWSVIPGVGTGELNSNAVLFNFTESESKIIEDVEAIKSNVDRLVLSLHWGNEFVHVPSPSQVRFARTLIDHGVDIIIGHHPHVLQPAENYNGGLIFYSLGNFVFDYWMEECNQSAIIEIDLDDPGNYELHPIKIGPGFMPIPAGGKAHVEQIKNALAAPHIEDQDAYLRLVYKKRQIYRISALRHIFRNLLKFLGPSSGAFWKWLFGRAIYVLRIYSKEKNDPSIVYRKQH